MDKSKLYVLSPKPPPNPEPKPTCNLSCVFGLCDCKNSQEGKEN